MKKARKISLSFVAVVGVSFVVLAVMGYYIDQTRAATRQTRAFAEQTRALARQNRDLILAVRVLALDGKQAKLGICSYKADLRRRIGETAAGLARSRDYLHEHPTGAPGIPRKLIEESIKTQEMALKNQRDALRSLHVLHCA